MNVLAHCRVYPLSTFYKPSAVEIDWLGKNSFGNVVLDCEQSPSAQKIGSIGFLHVIEHSFRVSAFKQSLLSRLVEKSPNQSFVLVMDLISCWNGTLPELQQDEKAVAYLNSPSLLNFDSLINFLVQLNESPQDALSRCQTPVSLQYQLAGIFIDNISYYTHDHASYDLLLKVLRMLRATYGCFIVTVGYGLEFYNGVERALVEPSHLTYEIPTRLPILYVKNMDCILSRDTETDARVVDTK
ncbi:LAME_0F07008g1_1 [Lachancea meyersii CBS 8951]|uniref:LAME_0F07008g1_1 n=1 Tax=Lachancea meyersii CBS 8951 TaxID=1266667 RepID=A0A1G4JTS7_9SACH|nr:LAME_0F07008g1_1 [Lachancea meyersii CBS 8951]